MKYKTNFKMKGFTAANYVFLGATAILCLLPFVNLLSISLSDNIAVLSGNVKFLPVDFTLSSYFFVMKSSVFLKSLLISIERVILGVSVNMLLIILTAYPLSKDKKSFKMRGFYSWLFIITMLFGGGLIPWYMVIKSMGLIDSIWALVIPSGLPVFSMILMLNFFRELPKELEEAAFIDGAGHFKILWEIFLPLSKPAIATMTLFCIVYHWNSWFDGLILMNRTEHYPLQSYLQTIIINPESIMKTQFASKDIIALLGRVNSRTVRAAQLFVGALPILIAYPFLQKYFTTGLVLGSVKG